MWTRRRIASTTAVLTVLALFAWLTFHSSEPSYQGKSLSAWLEQASRNQELEFTFPDVRLDTPTACAIRAMGKDAVPYLIRMARTRDTPLRRRFVDLSYQYDWIGLHPQHYSEIQAETWYGFLVLGPAAKTALPELISMLDDPAPEVRANAAFAIGKIGPDAASALPALQTLINNWFSRKPQREFSDERVLTAYALGEIGSAARSALPQIELLKKDADHSVRSVAEAAFVKITGNGLGTILESLKDPSNWTNWLFAAHATKFLGPNGAQAIPFLIQALQHTNPMVRLRALDVLSSIHTSPEITVPAILPLLASANNNVVDRFTALAILRNLGPSARAMVPTATLLQALADPDWGIRAQATNTLRQIDPEAARKAGIDSGDDRN